MLTAFLNEFFSNGSLLPVEIFNASQQMWPCILITLQLGIIAVVLLFQ